MYQTIVVPFALCLFVISACVPLLLFVVNPLVLLIRAYAAPRPVRRDPSYRPSVTIICVFRDAAEPIVEKTKNLLDLDYPLDCLDILLYEDEATEEAARALAPFLSERVHYTAAPKHVGKNRCLNEAVKMASGDILVLTDVGAKLDRRAIAETAAYFADPQVGGAFGNLALQGKSGDLDVGQKRYWKLDSVVRRMETRSGSLTSNSGQLSIVRKELWQTLPPDVTDDLYTCLSVVRQGKRFVFVSGAIVHIAPRSRDPRHEINRRRRIVNRSLQGIWRQRSLLNPFRFGFYSMHLFINKVLRRLLPIAGVLAFISTVVLASWSPVFLALFILQIMVLALAFSHLVLGRVHTLPRSLRNAASTAWYVLLGNWGVLLGLWDILRGKRVECWSATGGIERAPLQKPLRQDRES